MSTLSTLEKFELFHVTQEASQEIDAWIDTVARRRPDLSPEEAGYARELTTLAAMEYAAFFHLVEGALTSEDRALQVDQRAARAASARFDSTPNECYAVLRFARGQARVEDLFLFTSDVQKVAASNILSVNSAVEANDLDVFAKSVSAYSHIFDGTWIGEEHVVSMRIPAIWFARWCVNNSSSLGGAESEFRDSLLRFPELFRLLAPSH